MYIINPRLSADVFDGEYLIANLDNGLYYSIQGLAVSLVQSLPATGPEASITQLSSLFNDVNSVGDELEKIWKQLVAEHIIVESNATITANTEWVPATKYAPSAFNRYADMQDLLMLDPIHEVDEEGWQVKQND